MGFGGKTRAILPYFQNISTCSENPTYDLQMSYAIVCFYVTVTRHARGRVEVHVLLSVDAS
jgi:hypothetical protein